jgi:large-conductance mechanosensitive channel
MISYKVGTIFIPTDIKFEYETWYKNISIIGYVLFIGATIVSTITALFIYFIVKYAVDNRRKKNLND